MCKMFVALLVMKLYYFYFTKTTLFICIAVSHITNIMAVIVTYELPPFKALQYLLQHLELSPLYNSLYMLNNEAS